MTNRATAQADATTIKNETVAGANTATRVGSNLLEIATNAAFTEDIAFGSTGDVQPLGTATGGTSGKFADARHVHTMPSADQLTAQAADYNANAHKITGLTGGTATGQAVIWDQLPVFFEFALSAFPAIASVRQLQPGGASLAAVNGVATAELLIPDLFANGVVITGMRVYYGTANPTDSATFSLIQNESLASNGMAVTVAATVTTGTDTTAGHAQSFAGGDRLGMQFQSSGTTNTTCNIRVVCYGHAK